MSDETAQRRGEAAPPPRRRRRAVGPVGAPTAPDEARPVWTAEPEPGEDDDERLLREVPPHHGA